MTLLHNLFNFLKIYRKEMMKRSSKYYLFLLPKLLYKLFKYCSIIQKG